MRRSVLALCCLLAAPAAWAEDLPQGPKAPPPEPLPEAACDTAKPDSGDWLLGRWVAPYSKWDFRREGDGLVWTLEQKSDINRDLGYKEGATFGGKVDTVTGCTIGLTASENGKTVFVFEGVQIEGGRIYGYAHNEAGQSARWTLRRMK
jgi:hypothetical protein